MNDSDLRQLLTLLPVCWVLSESRLMLSCIDLRFTGVPRHPTQELLLHFGFSRRPCSTLRAKVELTENDLALV